MRRSNHKIVHYDEKEDILGVYVKRGAEEEYVELAPGISVELDRKGNVIGFEILNASEILRPFLKSAAGAKKAPAYVR